MVKRCTFSSGSIVRFRTAPILANRIGGWVRFCDIIVAAMEDAVQLVHRRIAGSDENHGNLRTKAQSGTDRKTAFQRKLTSSRTRSGAEERICFVTSEKSADFLNIIICIAQ